MHYDKSLPPNGKKGKKQRKSYGTLQICLKKFESYKNIIPNDKAKFRVKFLGEEGLGTLLRPTLDIKIMDFLPTTVTYKIETKLYQFTQYLNDMGKIYFNLIDSRT